MYNLIYLNNIMIFLYPCSFCSFSRLYSHLYLNFRSTNVKLWIVSLMLFCLCLRPLPRAVSGGAPRSGRTPLSFFGVWRPPDLCLAPPWALLRGNLATPWEKSWNRPPPICSPAPRVYFGTYCVCQNERTVAVHLMCTQYRMENDTTITKAPCFPATLEHAACSRTHER